MCNIDLWFLLRECLVIPYEMESLPVESSKC